MRSPSDEEILARAVALARRGEGHTRPNPPVGAVIVSSGRILGEGFHRRCGGDHAEVAAIKDALKRNPGVPPRRLFARATLYVTLEPCSKPGRVGACTDAIAAVGIGRVVYAERDPNPKNRGKAVRALARRGIACRRVELPEAARLIAPFAKHVTTALPFVTVKIAMSLDGRICDGRGNARWVSSARARAITGELRERVDAIMVGAETVRCDNPSLLPHGGKNDDLLRVVVSRSGRLPRAAQVFADGRNATLVFKDAREAIESLGKLGCLHVLCEGGLNLATSLAEEGLVDEWITVLAPKVIGSRPIEKAVIIGDTTCLLDSSNASAR